MGVADRQRAGVSLVTREGALPGLRLFRCRAYPPGVAKKILISTVVIGATRYYAGALLDVSAEADAIAAVVAAGGQLVDQGDPVIDAAALTAQQKLRDGQWREVDGVMLAAVAKSAYAASQGGGSAAGPQRDLYLNMQASEVDLVGIADSTASVSLAGGWGEGLRNAVVVFPVGWDGGDLVFDGTARGAVVQETFASPGLGGGTVVGVKLFSTVGTVTNTAPAGLGVLTAQIQPGRRIGATRAPISVVEKVTMSGDIKTPSAVNLVEGWAELPEAVVPGGAVELVTVVA